MMGEREQDGQASRPPASALGFTLCAAAGAPLRRAWPARHGGRHGAGDGGERNPHKPFYHSLYVQVLTAIAIGIALGHFYPQLGEQMKPLGDAFIKMIKMIIAPIIFCTVVHGIASMQDMKKVGRVGLKALIYFEVLTTIALIVGLIVANTLQPGAGHERRRQGPRHQGHPGLRRQVQGTGHRPVPDGHHPQHRGRRIRVRAKSCRCCSSPFCSRSGCRRSASAASRCSA